MVTHKSIIHGVCPINRAWDYYDVKISTHGDEGDTDIFIDVLELEKLLDAVRGKTMTQEGMADFIVNALPAGSLVKLVGRHSPHTITEVVA